MSFLPAVTITDAPTAYAIANALRQQADASRRVADRLASPAYAALSSANMRNAGRLVRHAQHLDNIATECESQGLSIEAAALSDDFDTVVIPVTR